MRRGLSWGGVGLSRFAALALMVAGCGQTSNKASQAKEKDANGKVAQAKQEEKGHDHSGWWCEEHGVPEAECSQCLPDAEVKKRFKDKGDWCEKHSRAMSQCFICNPRAKEKYVALYRVKYGKEPPPTEEEKKDKKGAKK
jgi:hypothetical protein